ncbi:MAG: isoprenylcysteine carboxylmethyltransferase family protein [Thermoanaerobaculaceae bacterium]|nr:isoprenylcysteine carboxylmethyltransferase family protein [Thermoanaerobaculaceae bacterium]TAM48536.1 MAG: isoprenylcysteine carboxylmethyltransferase family protein [Acidobacteriota bacterium]
MSDDGEIVPGVPIGEMPVAWTLLVVGCAAGALATGEFSRVTLRAAAPLLLAGGLLALAAVRAIGRGTRPATRGPYRFVRHPYLAGVLLMLVGAIVAMRSLPALVLFIPTVRVTLMRARREEHNLALRFGDAYEAYWRRVPFMLPLRPPLRADEIAAIEALSRPRPDEPQPTGPVAGPPAGEM